MVFLGNLSTEQHHRNQSRFRNVKNHGSWDAEWTVFWLIASKLTHYCTFSRTGIECIKKIVDV